MSARGPGSLDDLVAVDGDQEQLGRLGCDLINRLFVLVRTTLLFDLNNEALQRPVRQLLESMERLAQAGETRAALGVVGDNLSLNQALLRPDPATYNNGQFLGRLYRRLQIQELELEVGIGEAGLRRFMERLRPVAEGKADTSTLADLAGIRLVPITEADAGGQSVEIDSRIQVLRTFAGAIAVTARVMALAEQGLRWSPSLVRRVAHDLADAATKEPDLLAGLVQLPVEGNRLGVHLVRTAVLTGLCAARLGLPRRVWAEAALIALCHHLARPDENAFHSEELLDMDRPVGETEPLHAALALCGGGGLNQALIRRVVGIYEAAGAGDPRLYHCAAPGDLLGQITALADRLVMLMDNLLPDEALRVLLVERQDEEPQLCRLLVGTVGLYPVGSLVELESGELAVVVKAPRGDGQLGRPVVQVIRGERTGLVDLSRTPELGGIVATRDPAQLGENVIQYFLL